MKQLTIKIADIIFGLYSDHPNGLHGLESSYSDFICAEPCDVRVTGHYNGLPDMPFSDDNKVYDSNLFWDVHIEDKRFFFVLKEVAAGQDPFCIATFSPDFKEGNVFYRLPFHGDIPHPLAFPLFHLLMISILAKRHGLLVHACGIDDNGKGILFPASPDFGKTTMAKLWQDEATILNDERVALRLRDDGLYICGTPWHGDYKRVSTRCVPLKKIYFLKQAKDNTVCRQHGAAAALRLLSHCFHPYWDVEGMNFITGFAANVVGDVPCYELGFVPDKEVIEFLRCVK